MKKLHHLLPLTLFILLFSCSKDNNNEHNESDLIVKDTHRLKQVNMYIFGDEVLRENYTYIDEKIALIFKVRNDGVIDSFKSEFSYSGDTVTKIYYGIRDGNWEMQNKVEYIIKNSLKIQDVISFYEGEQWIKNKKNLYQYSSNSLIARQLFVYENETAIERYKFSYAYKDNKLTTYREFKKNEYDNWEEYKYLTYTYSGDKILVLKQYIRDAELNWIFSNKTEYSYPENNVTEAKNYSWDSFISEDWSLATTQINKYNNEGYIIESEMNYVMAEGFDNIITYEYENAYGNTRLFQ